MRGPLALLALLALPLSLAGCGLQPMYAGGASSGVAQGLAAVDVPAMFADIFVGHLAALCTVGERERVRGGTRAHRYRTWMG